MTGYIFFLVFGIYLPYLSTATTGQKDSKPDVTSQSPPRPTGATKTGEDKISLTLVAVLCSVGSVLIGVVNAIILVRLYIKRKRKKKRRQQQQQQQQQQQLTANQNGNPQETSGTSELRVAENQEEIYTDIGEVASLPGSDPPSRLNSTQSTVVPISNDDSFVSASRLGPPEPRYGRSRVVTKEYIDPNNQPRARYSHDYYNEPPQRPDSTNLSESGCELSDDETLSFVNPSEAHDDMETERTYEFRESGQRYARGPTLMTEAYRPTHFHHQNGVKRQTYV